MLELDGVRRFGANESVEGFDGMSLERAKEIVEDLYNNRDPFRNDDDRETAIYLMDVALTMCRINDRININPLHSDDFDEHWTSKSYVCYQNLLANFRYKEDVEDDTEVDLSISRAREIVKMVLDSNDETVWADLVMRNDDTINHAFRLINRASEIVTIVTNDLETQWKDIATDLVTKFGRILEISDEESLAFTKNDLNLKVRIPPFMELRALINPKNNQTRTRLTFFYDGKSYSMGDGRVIQHVRDQMELHKTALMRMSCMPRELKKISFNTLQSNQKCEIEDEINHLGGINRTYFVTELRGERIVEIFKFVVTISREGVLSIPKLADWIELGNGQGLRTKNVVSGDGGEIIEA